MTSQSASWTIMVYISADNVLANFAIESLKQLRDAAGDGISVIAEFDDNQHDDARLYFFDGDPKKRALPIESSRIPEREIAHLKTIRGVDMTRPESLTEFVDYASGRSKTERYALVLWGHGIELLLDESRRFGTTNGSVGRYLTTANLRKALQETKIVKGELEASHPKVIWGDAQAEPKKRNTLDVVGLDACSLSMVEVASELQGSVDFMIASQEDVPDASFPYARILADLKAHGVRNDVREVCRLIPGLYQQAFRDYIATPDTGVKGITLASLNLAQIGTITEPVTQLAAALLRASNDKSLRREILAARKEAKSFVFGLLVDLSDFCQCLEAKLASKGIEADGLCSACEQIQKAIKARSDDACVLENKVDESRCNGISIYFPYRGEDETDDVEELFAKGGSRQPLKGGSRQPLKERTARIRELEADFADLHAFRGTGWNEFIKRGWSFILANEIPFELDLHYSAEQVSQNLLSRGPELVSVREGASAGPAEFKEPPAA
jgi:cysteine peptidase C11 family protein